MDRLYEMSVLRLRYPDLTFDQDAIDALLVDLGKEDGPSDQFERALATRCSGAVAIERYPVAPACQNSVPSDLAHDYLPDEEPPYNLVVALEIETGRPVCSTLCEGQTIDFMAQIPFENVTVLTNLDFGHGEDRKAFLENGNNYVMPLGPDDERYTEAVSDLNLPGRFTYVNKKDYATIIEYADRIIDDRRVLVVRNVVEQLLEQEDFERNMAWEEDGYTAENYERYAPYMGIHVLETSLDHNQYDAEAVYRLCMRWQDTESHLECLECLRNSQLPSLKYRSLWQGLALVLLVSSLIEHEVKGRIAKAYRKRTVADVLTDARAIKIVHERNTWVAVNRNEKRDKLFDRLGIGLDALRTS